MYVLSNELMFWKKENSDINILQIKFTCDCYYGL